MEKFEKLDDSQKELVKYWIEKYESGSNMTKEDFIFAYLTPGPVVEAGFWYKGLIHHCEKLLLYVTGFNSHREPIGYGFDVHGEWNVNTSTGWTKDLTKATSEEVEQCLFKEANKRGFIDGAKVIGIGETNSEMIRGTFFVNSLKLGLNAHLKNNGTLGVTIFKDGKWADIIDEKQHIRESIERLEAELMELKSKL